MWRDRLRQGSIRGVPVYFRQRSLSGGHRLQVDSFPGQDAPAIDGLGLEPRWIAAELYLVGPNYDETREALLTALETAGPASVVDIWRGECNAWVKSYTLEEQADESGTCRFQVTLVRDDAEPAPRAKVETGIMVGEAAEAFSLEALSGFARDFLVVGLPAFVSEAAAELTTEFGDVMGGLEIVNGIAGGLAGGGDLRSQFTVIRSRFQQDALSLVTGKAFGSQVMELVSLFASLSGGGREALPGLASLSAFGGGPSLSGPSLNGTTPARQVIARNHGALTGLIRAAALGEEARALRLTRFGSYDEAARLRDGLTARLETEAVAAADRGDDGFYRRAMSLKARVIEDVTARGGSLARLTKYEMASSVPALVLAHRLYGTAARADELSLANRAAHPGFMPVTGTALTS